MQMPLTTDHGAAQLFISSASPDALPQQGTVISDALKMGERVFNNTEDRFKSVILITDGEDHDDAALTTASALSEKGVMINAVGIGSPEGGIISDPSTGGNKTDEAGNTVVSKLNEELLMGIAGRTNGIYIRLQSSDEAVAMMQNQLLKIDKKAYADITQMNFRNYYGWLAVVMLLLLFAEYVIPEKRKTLAV
jgi:Ca-activated chloride channel family protein